MCVAHCDAVGYIALRGVIMNNEELALRIQQGEDVKKNMQQLYDQNYYLLRKTAKKYSNIDSMTDIDDLMQELYIPLYEATISYKADNGATFITYALTCISRHLKRYLDDVGRVIRVPVHTQEKIYKYNQVSSYFMRIHNRKPTDREFRAYLELTQKQLDSLKKDMGVLWVDSTETKIADNMTIDEVLEDKTAYKSMEEVEESIDRDRLSTSLWEVIHEVVKDPTDVQVLEDRYKHNDTLKECGNNIGVTTERARVRESRAMRQLRNNRKIKEIGEAEGIVKPIRSYKRNKRVSIDYGSMTDDEVFSMYEAMM